MAPAAGRGGAGNIEEANKQISQVGNIISNNLLYPKLRIYSTSTSDFPVKPKLDKRRFLTSTLGRRTSKPTNKMQKPLPSRLSIQLQTTSSTYSKSKSLRTWAEVAQEITFHRLI